MRGVIASRSGAPTRLSLPAQVGLHTVLLLFSGVMLAPFLVMVVVSLIPNAAFLARDFSPENFSLQNYVRTFQVVPFGRYYFNSIVVSVSVTVLQILISSLAAFAFARLRFRGRDALFLFYLATLMIPFPVTLIPNFLIIKALGWYDTYWALIVPGLFSVFSTFLLRQYYRGIPLDFDEAAHGRRVQPAHLVADHYPAQRAGAGDVGDLRLSRRLERFPLAAGRHHLRTHAHHSGGAGRLRRTVQHGVGSAHGRLGDCAVAGAGDLYPRSEMVRGRHRSERHGRAVEASREST